MARGQCQSQPAAARDLPRVDRRIACARGAVPSRPPTVPLVPERKSSAVARVRRRGFAAAVGPCAVGARSRSASSRRPELWATIVSPAGQRRRTTWPTQPASVLSSCCSDGRQRPAGVEAACCTAARVGARGRASVGARRRRRGDARPPPRPRRERGAPGSLARSRSCHSCSSPPCSSDTSNGPTRSRARAADRHVRAPRVASRRCRARRARAS